MSAVRTYLRPAYHALRGYAHRLDRVLDQRTVTLAAFEELLSRAGLNEGATVMLHSSMDAVSRRMPAIGPVELIRLIQARLTASGTLLMPTFPFAGKQAHYVEQRSRFDARRTPSQVGLLTEVFRRMPDVQRSLHPTHPIAGWGKHAAILLSDHHEGGAFGPNSPIYRLRDFDGLVVGLGTGLRDSFTILHVPEEIHPAARARFFESRTRTMTIVDGAREIPYSFQALRPDVRRNYDRVERLLVREAILRYVEAHGLRCATTPAKAFIDRCMALVDEGRYL